MRRVPILYMLVCGAALPFVPGCSSSIRYTRPGGAVVGPGIYRVPRNWDYRADYRIPADRLVRIIDSYVGVRYKYGGTSRSGVDCSGLVFLVFRELNHARMPRSTRRLKKLGKPVPRSELQHGDLVFLSMKNNGMIDHVGIYTGNGRFAHASSSKGVMYSNLRDDYFQPRIVYIRRVF